jgi:(p)ppGpp synthase/HD superfamily hydrolase
MLSVATADALARVAHGRDRTRIGELFIDHVRSVAARLSDDPDPYAVPAALLHDTVEKGSMSWVDLRAAGADDRLIAVVHALTERDGETPEQYLARCAADPLALRIKRIDITDKLEAPAARSLSPDHAALLRDHVMGRLALLEQVAADLADR